MKEEKTTTSVHPVGQKRKPTTLKRRKKKNYKVTVLQKLVSYLAKFYIATVTR